MSGSTKIKICGVTNESDLQMVLDAGADAVGFNFVSSSSRYIADLKCARSMMDILKARGVLGVGVFARQSTQEVVEIAGDVGLDVIQLHGDEALAMVEEVGRVARRPVWKVFRVSCATDLDVLRDTNWVCDAFVLDSRVTGGALGGTGETFDWSILDGLNFDRPWILAGGLHPGNVKEAVTQTRPAWADVASGVESAPGVKCPEKVKQFIQAVRDA